MIRSAILVLLAAMCGACEPSDETAVPVERIVQGPVRLDVEADGEIGAAEGTPLTVPGQQWTQRQCIWLSRDGEPVKRGDLIARFDTQQSELELAQIVTDLERIQLSRMATEETLDSERRNVRIELVDVETRLAIARRYTDVDLSINFSRNELLDAIDDEHFLDILRDALVWQRNRATQLHTMELGVLEAQKASHERNAALRKEDLTASELRAPHDGVLMLAPDGAGEKPRAGINMMAGQVLGHLPNLASLEVELRVPQAAGERLSVGQKVHVQLTSGRSTSIETALSTVARTAQPRNRDNPAPYITVKAPLPQKSVRALGLVPGMRVQARIDLWNSTSGITVPNVAVLAVRGSSVVQIRNRVGGIQSRQIELGMRGGARSVVRNGLRTGDLVLLTPRSDAATAPLVETVALQ